MKRYLSLVITLSIITSVILMTGCSSQSTQNVTSQAVASDTHQSKEQNLIDCLNATKKVDSVQCNVNLNSKSGDQSIALKIDMQAENIQKNMKSKFVIGNDGYLNNVDVKATVGTAESEISTDYSNYNKKFNIVLPEVSK